MASKLGNIGDILLTGVSTAPFAMETDDLTLLGFLISCHAAGLVAFGMITNLIGIFTPAPWGRFSNRSASFWGPHVPMWIGWMFQESPSAIIPVFILLWSRLCQGRIFNTICLTCFSIHYLNRAFIYTIRHYWFPTNGRSGTVPIFIPLAGFVFCTINGIVQSISSCLFDYSHEMRGFRYALSLILSEANLHRNFARVEMLHRVDLWDVLALLRFCIGLWVFFLGMYINIQCDNQLLELKHRAESGNKSQRSYEEGERVMTLRRSSRLAAKREHDSIVTFKFCSSRHAASTGVYKIPRGGWFEFVSCANYWGEICEWCGYALMCNTLAAAAFAIFTAFFLGRRGVQTHKWYRARFGNKYPRHRNAVIPFLV